MSRNIRIRNFLTPPTNLPPEEQRWFVMITIVGVLGTLFHGAYIALFYWMGLHVLFVQNIISVLIWALLTWLGRKGYDVLAGILGGIELFVYVALGTYFVGWDSGIHYIIWPAIVTFLVAFRRPRAKVFWALTYFFEYIFLYFTADRIVWQGNLEVINMFFLANVITTFVIIFVAVWYQTNLVATAEDAMNRAFDQSEALLNNILPPVIADRLKKTEGVIADSFPEASILFADIADFTPFSEKLTPVELVNLLDDLFSRIDVIVAEHKLEKIKTIGDAYMVAAGVPVRRSDHAEAMAAFAFDLQKALIAYNKETGHNLQFRIGINSGPVVAGVIGKLRFLYDLWGDSVNTASRMESHGIPNEIQVTEETRKLLLGKYAFKDRGIIDIKGKGPMRTYLLRMQEEAGV